MKSITFITNENPLLEDISKLSQQKPEQYVGYIYLWRCIPENTFYCGSHKGTITDGYDGSGSLFKQVFRHYGATQFERVILEYVQDIKKLKYVEQKWIDKFNAIKSNKFYNKKNAVAI